MKIVFENDDNSSLISVNFEKRVWSKASLPSIGAIWSYLKAASDDSTVSSVRFDFYETIWVEVPTLLAVVTLANQISELTSVEFRFDGKGIASNLRTTSKSEANEGKLKFMSFLRSMGFFSVLPDASKITLTSILEGRETPLELYSPAQFEELINGISFQPFIQAVTLIPLQVMSASEFVVNSADTSFAAERLKDKIKQINENAALNMASAGFHKGTMHRQRVLLSVDKILQESLSNIIEHGYSLDDKSTFFAFYSRIRNPNSTFEGEFKNGLYSANDEFDHSKDVNWTELYVCDFGCGIEAQLPHWLQAEEAKAKPNRSLLSDLKKAQKSSNAFLHASRLLFDHSLSRHIDRSSFRSPQTGLQDVKRVLMDAGYVDITNGSAVNRRRFTARPGDKKGTSREIHEESRTPFLVTERERQYIIAQFPDHNSSIRCEFGTHLVYRSQLSSEIPPFKQPGYRAIGRRQAVKVLDVYKRDFTLPKSHILVDKRFAHSSQPEDQDVRDIIKIVRSQKRNSTVTLFLRLSRNPYKNDVNEWLRVDRTTHGAELTALLIERGISISLQIVDVLPVYAGWLRERIASFAKTQWLSKSGLTEVGVFTNLFHFVVFEKISDGYRVSRRSVSDSVNTIMSVASALRQMDSEAFWRSYPGNELSDVYINEDIEWIVTHRRLGEAFSNEFPMIRGFLDFSTSLQSLERYRVCERALLRFMALLYNLNSDDSSAGKANSLMLLPTMVSSDSMTQRLAKSVQTLFSEVANFNDDSVLVLSSVVVTGQTKDRAALGVPRGNDVLGSMKVCFFNREGSTEAGNKDFSLMRWMPPEKSEPNGRPAQKRIFRTAEISPRGALDIRIPHVLEREGKRFENYQRDRAETYADFEILGALQFGHSQKSNRHELISLNFSALVPLVISSSHSSWSWLSEQFYNAERDSECMVVVVYPNQPHAEQIIQELKHREPSRVPQNRVTFISAPFLKSRKTEPIIVSPRLEQRLSEHLAQLDFQKERRGGLPAGKLKVRIFDAGIVTGRTIRALEQQIESVFQQGSEGSVHRYLEVSLETISLVDRSGQPIYGTLLEKYSEKNKRFWRWDVPSLTENGTCRVCLANRRIEQFSNQSNRLARGRSRLSLVPESRLTDFFGGNFSNGDRLDWLDNLSGILINHLPQDLQKVTFGYYADEPNEVHLASALQYVSVFSELTRLLHRSDISLNRAMELISIETDNEDNSDCLAVLILASHLLLFYETFDKFERVNYAVELFGILVDFDADWAERNVRSLANYYGILALYSLEPEDIEVLKGPSFFCEWLRRKRLSNPHLVNYIKDISGAGLPFPIESEEKITSTDIWLENVRRLRSDSALVVERLLDLLGNERVWHSGELYYKLAMSGITHNALQGSFSNLRDLIKEAQGLAVFHCSDASIEIIEEQSDKSADVPITGAERRKLLNVLEGSPDSLRTALFSSLVSFSEPSLNEPAWSNRKATKKLLNMMLSSDGDGAKAYLGRLNSALKNPSNRAKVSDLFDYMGVDESGLNLPFAERSYLIPSLDCRRVVESVVLNSRHATRKIPNPFDSGADPTKTFYVWASISRVDDIVVLNLINATKDDPNCGSIYASRFPGFFSEGHLVDVEFDAARGLLSTKIRFTALVRR